jgi:chromate transporter
LSNREEAAEGEEPALQRGSLAEVGGLFLRLGATSFGGPAAHIALMRDEFVARRRWLTDEEFLDLLGATNLIPGPNSTEMAIHIGYRRAGWPGLLAAGTAFILPATLIVLLFAWAYVEYGSTPEAGWLLYGVKPVIIAVVVAAIWSLARSAAKTLFFTALGVAALLLYALGANELNLLLGGGAVAMLWGNRARLLRRRAAPSLVPFTIDPAHFAQATSTLATYDLGTLLLTFLKIGSVLYGSGYVLLTFLRGDFVERLGWLTDRQLLDAVAVGQFTPGPFFTTATFIGYVLGGVVGGLIATLGIFLPAFVFVALSVPLVPRIRRSAWAAPFLDGVNVAALALMSAVAWELGRSALFDAPTILISLAAALLLIRFRVNSVWLVLAGAALGYLLHLLGLS